MIWVLKQGREHRHLPPALLAEHKESPMADGAETGGLGRSTRREVRKRWITVPLKAIQLWHSLGVYHNISLCLHKVCMQPLQPKEKSVCYDIPSVCRTRQSLGKVSHTFQSFLSIVGFPLLRFWMPLKNHKNFPSCGVSSLLPQNETNQNEKQLDQKEIY